MAEKRMFIYKITNLKNGKIYIGRTCQTLKTRLQQHFSDSKYLLNNSPLHYDMKNYNKDDFTIECVLEFYTNDYKYADNVELYYILKLKSFVPQGYNVRRVK